jgi:hypothetical protein
MDERTRAEVIKALRTAVRALRAAEKAIVQAPATTGAPATDPSAPASDPQAAQVDPVETALLNYIKDSAATLKKLEEQDPRFFVSKLQTKQADLLRFAMSKQMFQEGPKGAGATALDPTPATQTFEKLLKVMTETGINQTDLLAPFVNALVPKNWADVNVDEDLVLFRFQTPGPVKGSLNRQAFESLVEDARKVPGALDRVAALVKEDHIAWEPTDAKTGTINCAIVINNVDAKWCGCVPTSEVLASVVSHLSVIEVDDANQQQGWWDAARIAPSLPQQVLPIIRGKDKKVIFLRTDADKVEDWAGSLPGWYDGPEECPTPLIVRDAVSNDILS